MSEGTLLYSIAVAVHEWVGRQKLLREMAQQTNSSATINPGYDGCDYIYVLYSTPEQRDGAYAAFKDCFRTADRYNVRLSQNKYNNEESEVEE